MDLVIVGKLIAIIVLVMGNAFFVGSEIALTSARRSRIKQLADTGNKSARIVQILHDEPEQFYSVTQIGITLVSLALGAIGIVTITEVSEPGIDWLATHLSIVIPPEHAHAIAHTTAQVFAFIFISFLHIVGGELAPKVYAFHAAESLSLTVAWPVNFLYRIFVWAIWILNQASNGLLRMFGQNDLTGGGGGHFSISEDELRTILVASEREGILNPDETKMIRGVFDLDERKVRDAMTPRIDIGALPSDATINDTLEFFRQDGHARVPVIDGSMDRIVGFVPIKELLNSIGPNSTPENMQREVTEIMLPPYLVPDSQPLSKLLKNFKSTRQQMAIAVDEHGGTAGIITLEDVLEEIVGDYADEFSPTQRYVKATDDEDVFLIDASARVDELEPVLDFPFPLGDYVTLAGLLYDKFGQVPEVGNVLELPGCEMKVEAMDNHRITKVLFTHMEVLVDEEDESGTGKQTKKPGKKEKQRKKNKNRNHSIDRDLAAPPPTPAPGDPAPAAQEAATEPQETEALSVKSRAAFKP